MCINHVFNKHLRKRIKRVDMETPFYFSRFSKLNCYSFSNNLVCSILTS